MAEADLFSGLDDAFNVDFSKETEGSSELVNQVEEELDGKIAERKEKASKIAELINSGEGFSEDETLVLRKSLLHLMSGNTDMLERLEKDYHIAPQPRGAEVYSTLASSQAGLIKTLIDLNKELVNKKKAEASINKLNAPSINAGNGTVNIVNNNGNDGVVAEMSSQDIQKLFQKSREEQFKKELLNVEEAEVVEDDKADE